MRENVETMFTINLLENAIHLIAVRMIHRANTIIFHPNRPAVGLGHKSQNSGDVAMDAANVVVQLNPVVQPGGDFAKEDLVRPMQSQGPIGLLLSNVVRVPGDPVAHHGRLAQRVGSRHRNAHLKGLNRRTA